MDENKASQLLKEFADWYEEFTGDDISSYDQDTTPYAVWEFLTHSNDRHLTPVETDAESRRCKECGGIVGSYSANCNSGQHTRTA